MGAVQVPVLPSSGKLLRSMAEKSGLNQKARGRALLFSSQSRSLRIKAKTGSMGHEDRNIGILEHKIGHAAQYCFTEAAVAVSAHNDHGGTRCL